MSDLRRKKDGSGQFGSVTPRDAFAFYALIRVVARHAAEMVNAVAGQARIGHAPRRSDRGPIERPQTIGSNRRLVLADVLSPRRLPRVRGRMWQRAKEAGSHWRTMDGWLEVRASSHG